MTRAARGSCLTAYEPTIHASKLMHILLNVSTGILLTIKMPRGLPSRTGDAT